MGDHGRRILLVSYYFPPAGGVSVQRMLSLAKYLPRDGCELGVLTPLNGAYPVADPELLKAVPADVRIHRAFTPELPYELRRKLWSSVAGDSGTAATPTPPRASWKSKLKSAVREPVRKLLVPDPQVLWAPFAIQRGAQLIAEYGYDTLLVTAPPYSSFVIGNALKRRFPHLRLISDFRDDWFGFYLGGVDSMASQYKREKAFQLERETVETSDLVVAVTEATRDDIRARYPRQPDHKFQVIPNGYDPKSFATLHPRPHGLERMVVTYVGTVYTPCTPRHYLDAVDTLPPELRQKIETRFVGRVIDSERAFLQSRQAPLKSYGFLPQPEAIRFMEETDYLLLVVDDPQTVSAKLFEYLASGKPILALTPENGESARLVRRTRAGIVADPRDVRGIRTLLEEAYARYTRREHAVSPDWDEIRRYERPRLAAEYLALMRRPLPVAAPELELKRDEVPLLPGLVTAPVAGH